jgi:hypothetical protein
MDFLAIKEKPNKNSDGILGNFRWFQQNSILQPQKCDVARNETGRQTDKQTERVSVCVCVCVRERERERETDRQTDRQRDRETRETDRAQSERTMRRLEKKRKAALSRRGASPGTLDTGTFISAAFVSGSGFLSVFLHITPGARSARLPNARGLWFSNSALEPKW